VHTARMLGIKHVVNRPHSKATPQTSRIAAEVEPLVRVRP
jgi:hypothetical protein